MKILFSLLIFEVINIILNSYSFQHSIVFIQFKFQAWNQLSRLQRNLLYLLFIILAFACFWNITRLKIRSHPKNSNSSKDESSLLSNVDRLINNRMKEIDDEVRLFLQK